MFRHTLLAAAFLALAAAPSPSRAGADDESPAFTTVPELADGFHLLYA